MFIKHAKLTLFKLGQLLQIKIYFNFFKQLILYNCKIIFILKTLKIPTIFLLYIDFNIQVKHNTIILSWVLFTVKSVEILLVNFGLDILCRLFKCFNIYLLFQWYPLEKSLWRSLKENSKKKLCSILSELSHNWWKLYICRLQGYYSFRDF